jgi:diguanylate cyclase (GGDEF)-like protein/putative nucleotidyltransferase with HDIG domain
MIALDMATSPLAALAKLALEATKQEALVETLVKAMELMRQQTGAISALIFYEDGDKLSGSGVGQDAASYPQVALQYLQRRLQQVHLPLAFNLSEGEVRNLTRAANKQPREQIAWLVPVTDSKTELLVLHGTWPPSAIQPLIDTVDAAMPALVVILQRFLGVGYRERLEQQLSAISVNVDTLRESASVIGSVAALYPSFAEAPTDGVSAIRGLANAAIASLEEVRASRELMESHLRLQEYASRLERAVQLERQNANTDPLTGLLNSRGALDVLQTATETAALDGKSVSVLLGDINGFKLFNDTYGHVSGDQVLTLIASIFRTCFEQVGSAARYGGDEFLIILPNFEKQAAIDLARQAADRLGRAEFSGPTGTVPISMSIGVATYPEDSTSISALIAIADSAMYAAKNQVDRKTVVVSSVPETHFGVLEGLVMAVHAKDRYTKDHCDIVAEYAVKLAVSLNLPEESKRALSIAGLLHDIGKLVIPDEILKKPSRLTPAEQDVMRQHVRVGEALIREVPQLREVQQAVACHHEHYDGSGYPRGLKGEEIPLLGRVIGIADAYSAMCLDRPYRKALRHDQILNVYVKDNGKQFDPGIADVFVKLILEEQLRTRGAA